MIPDRFQYFLDDFGNFENKLSKSGPVDLLTITKIAKKIQENYGIILETYYLCQYGTQQIENFRKMYVLGTMFVCLFFSVFL